MSGNLGASESFVLAAVSLVFWITPLLALAYALRRLVRLERQQRELRAIVDRLTNAPSERSMTERAPSTLPRA